MVERLPAVILLRSGLWSFPVFGCFACLSIWFGCMVRGLYEVIQYTHTHSLLSRTPKTAVKDHTFLSAQQNQVASTAKILRVSANRPPTAALPGAGAALSPVPLTVPSAPVVQAVAVSAGGGSYAGVLGCGA